jgi:hypothetical protein
LLESNGEFNKILSNVWDMLEARQSKDKLERLKVSRTLEERVTSLDFRNELSQQRSHIVELEAEGQGSGSKGVRGNPARSNLQQAGHHQDHSRTGTIPPRPVG